MSNVTLTKCRGSQVFRYSEPSKIIYKFTEPRIIKTVEAVRVNDKEIQYIYLYWCFQSQQNCPKAPMASTKAYRFLETETHWKQFLRTR